MRMSLIAIACAVSCALSGCAQQAATVQAPPVPFEGVGYVVLNAPINASSRDMLMADIDRFRNDGAREIRLGINSGGGDIVVAQTIVDYMARLHEQNGLTFKAYNMGLVASAATYIFLNAQERYAAPRSAFLFHAAGAITTGLVNAQNLHEAADKLDAYERTVRAAMKRRTKLSDSEAQTYVRRTVLLSADDAQRDGIVDEIGTFVLPKGARSWVIATKPAARSTAAAPATSTISIGGGT